MGGEGPGPTRGRMRVQVAVDVFAAIGLLVTLAVAVRLPVWVREIRAEDRAAREEATTAEVERALEEWIERAPTEIPQAAIKPNPPTLFVSGSPASPYGTFTP